MGKKIRRIIMVVLLVIFVGAVGYVGVLLYQYNQSSRSYEAAAEQFIIVRNETDGTAGSNAGSSSLNGTQGSDQVEIAPLVIDFDALQAAGPDVIGWLYCADTIINYPVLHGTDNDMYLHHLYDGSYTYSGSIFVEAANRKNFEDANTIIYGHNMRDGSMFGTLDSWQDQEYYEAHPVFWLITPEQDYKIELLGGYTTSAYSDTYTIFSNIGAELNAYLDAMLAQSVFVPQEKPEQGAKYVLLSTCAYAFSDARFVLHGKLVPVDSAGGVLKTE